MKFTMTTILAAALATVSSAAAVPSAAVGESLPASFNLRVTTATRGTVLEPYLGLVYSESYVGQSLMIGPNPSKVAPTLYNLEGSAGVTSIDPSITLTKDMLIVNDSTGHTYPMGWVVNWVRSRNNIPGQSFFSGWASGDFVQVNNAFAYDARDGKGPQTLWQACPGANLRDTWVVFWNPPTSGCIPVELSVVKV